jgi:4-hydroxybenzoate polyprenyltransferase
MPRPAPHPRRGHTPAVPALVRACHPLPAATVTVLVSVLAWAAGRGAAGTAWVALAVGAGQCSVGWANDLVDRDRDRVARRTDKPVATGAVAVATVRRAAAIALVATVPLSLASGWRAGLVHLLAVAVAWGYDLGLKATLWSGATYLVAFGAVPAFVTLGLPGHPWPATWAVAAAALLGSGAHLVNALPDLDDDLAAGVVGLPQRLGARWSLGLGATQLAAAALLVALGPPGRSGALAVAVCVAVVAALTVVVLAARHGQPRAAWRATLLVAATTAALLVVRGGSITA